MGSDGRDDESSEASSTDYDRYIDFALKKKYHQTLHESSV